MASLKYNPNNAAHLIAAAGMKADDPDLKLIRDQKAPNKFAEDFAKANGFSYTISNSLRPEENSISKEFDRAITRLHSNLADKGSLQTLSNLSFDSTNTIKKLTAIAENALAMQFFDEDGEADTSYEGSVHGDLKKAVKPAKKDGND